MIPIQIRGHAGSQQRLAGVAPGSPIRLDVGRLRNEAPATVFPLPTDGVPRPFAAGESCRMEYCATALR